MPKNFYKKGAEAELSKTDFEGICALSKKRISKGYREKTLDDSIRKLRTRSEAKLIKEAASAVNVPHILKVDDKSCEIIMEFVEGVALKEAIEKTPALCEEAGREIKKLHDAGIIHGDLTTSNIIVSDKLDSSKGRKSNLVFVDFGLGSFSKKVEDKATDLIVFKKTFNATHSSLKNGWSKVLKGYSPGQEMILKMEAIEKRARYH
ncbi:MAG: KEOPS complex kinase/ATPase Bud32 [archaeon]